VSRLHAWWSHPPEQRAGRPVVVALHGRGADERSLAVLAADLPDGVVLACPRGPVPEGGGAAWWQMHAIGYPVAASLAGTRARLLRWLDDELPRADVALLGFSDGAVTAADLLLAQPHRFRAAVLLGGALPWSTGPPVEPGRLRGVAVQLSWGQDEDVVPRELLERTARWLLDVSGAEAEVHVEPGLAHLVDTAQVVRARELLTRVLPVERPDGPAQQVLRDDRRRA
jgi:phospholipase/carboxylesterase